MPKKTPWGDADYEFAVIPRAVTRVDTPSHGGLMVSKAWAEKHLSEAALDEAIVFGSYYAFEEDCAVNLVFHESQEVFRAYRDRSPGNISTVAMQNSIDHALVHYYQDYVAKREGRFTGLTVASVVRGSMVLGHEDGKMISYHIWNRYHDKPREWVVGKYIGDAYVGRYRMSWEFLHELVKYQHFEFVAAR